MLFNVKTLTRELKMLLESFIMRKSNIEQRSISPAASILSLIAFLNFQNTESVPKKSNSEGLIKKIINASENLERW